MNGFLAAVPLFKYFRNVFLAFENLLFKLVHLSTTSFFLVIGNPISSHTSFHTSFICTGPLVLLWFHNAGLFLTASISNSSSMESGCSISFSFSRVWLTALDDWHLSLAKWLLRLQSIRPLVSVTMSTLSLWANCLWTSSIVAKNKIICLDQK